MRYLSNLTFSLISHQRVICKDSDHRKKAHRWNARWFWSLDQSNNPIPTEAKTMYDLRSRVGSNYIVRILNWRLMARLKTHRIYLEYCPYRDMYYLCEPVDGPYSGKDEKPKWIPEPFIWYLAEALATVGLLMLLGELDWNPVSSRTPMLHRDLKVENILLSDPQSSTYCKFPTPKVCDFGNATYLRPEEVHNRQRDGTSGTAGCTAPESF